MSGENIVKPVRGRLFVMMAFEFFIWGAWLPLIWGYMSGLGFTGGQQVLIGSCFAVASVCAFFFATLYIFIDEAFPKDVCASAQGLFNLLILGIGDLLAKWIFLPLKGNLSVDGVVDYQKLFLVPTFMVLAAVIMLALFFRPKIGEPREDLPEEFPAEP
jgi:hypothetical protein